MEVSINYIGYQGVDTLQDHHSREGELLVGVPIFPIESLDSLRETFVEDLVSCAGGEDIPYEMIVKEAIAYFTEKHLNLVAFQQDWQMLKGDEGEDNEIYLQWWFLITYGEDNSDAI